MESLILQTIEITRQNNEAVLTAFGPDASRYTYVRELRDTAMKCWDAALTSSNRYFVLDGSIVRACQSTLSGAEQHMKPGYVLLSISHDTVCDELFYRLDNWNPACRNSVLDYLQYATRLRISAEAKRPLFPLYAKEAR